MQNNNDLGIIDDREIKKSLKDFKEYLFDECKFKVNDFSNKENANFKSLYNYFGGSDEVTCCNLLNRRFQYEKALINEEKNLTNTVNNIFLKYGNKLTTTQKNLIFIANEVDLILFRISSLKKSIKLLKDIFEEIYEMSYKKFHNKYR